MPEDIPVTEFICSACNHRTNYAVLSCPECGGGQIEEKPLPEIPASHFTPSGMYLAPVDPVATARSNIKAVQVLKILCGVMALCVFFLLVPFCVMPSAKGPDANGYYTLPKGRSQSAPSKVTARAINTGAIAIIFFSVALGAGYLFLQKKQKELEDKFVAEGNDLSSLWPQKKI